MVMHTTVQNKKPRITNHVKNDFYDHDHLIDRSNSVSSKIGLSASRDRSLTYDTDYKPQEGMASCEKRSLRSSKGYRSMPKSDTSVNDKQITSFHCSKVINVH